MILRYAARVNGLTELFVTKLDVLSGFETVRVCTAYRADDETFDDVPPHQSLFHKAQPVYEELEGWQDEIGGATAFGDLPAASTTAPRTIAVGCTRADGATIGRRVRPGDGASTLSVRPRNPASRRRLKAVLGRKKSRLGTPALASEARSSESEARCRSRTPSMLATGTREQATPAANPQVTRS